MDEVNATDVYIAIVGMTGAGKSFFATQCTGESPIHIGHGLESFTKRTTVHTMERSDRRIQLVDTPGFGDTYRSDEDVFLEIAYTLIKAYELGIQISGIVLLHSITDLRVTGSTRRFFEMLGRLCGPEAKQSVVLVANRCGEISAGKQQERLIELRSKLHLWQEFCESGCSVFEMNSERKSSLSVLDYILQRDQTYTLRFQEEVVDLKLKINETEAGKAIFSATSATEYDLRQELADLRQELKKAALQGSKNVSTDLSLSVDEVKAKLDSRIQDLTAMNADARSLESTWDRKYQEERLQMDARLNELQTVIQKLNSRLGERDASLTGYQQALRDMREAQSEKSELISVQSLQLSQKNLKAAKSSSTAGWIGAAAGVGSLAATTGCSVM